MKRLKVGDRVKVISGYDKNKVSKIKTVIRKKNQIIVEDVNIKIKHTKPVRSNEAGTIKQFEAPIDASNVMLCNSEGIVSRIGVYFDENGNKQRKPKNTEVTL